MPNGFEHKHRYIIGVSILVVLALIATIYSIFSRPEPNRYSGSLGERLTEPEKEHIASMLRTSSATAGPLSQSEKNSLLKVLRTN